MAFALEAIPELAWVAAPDGRIRFLNRRFIDYTGFTVEELGVEGPKGIVHPDEREAVMAHWRAAIETGEPYEVVYRLRSAADGSFRWFLSRAVPIRDADGGVAAWIGTATDVDEQRRARESLELVLEAEEALAGTLTVDDVARTLALVAIRRFADWCFVHLFEAPDAFRLIAFEHRDPSRRADVEAFTGRSPLRRNRAALVDLLRGGVILAPQVTDEQIVASADDAEHLAAMRALRMRSVMIAPMHDDAGVLLGALTLVSSESQRTFTPGDAEVAGRIAQRAGRALLVAQRYEAQRRSVERSRLVGTTSEALFRGESIGVDDTARGIVRACVPGIADRATIYLFEGAVPRPRATFDVDLGDAVAIEPSATVLPLDTFSRSAVAGGEQLTLPLRFRDVTIGALVLIARSTAGRGSPDGELAREIADRAAAALDAAARYERERRVSRTFQRAALPVDLPAIPGVVLTATYEAGRTDALVGGDWYDAFRLPDGRLVLSIGDVAGSGLEAAVTMGSVRQGIRTAAVINPEPHLVLDALDRVVRAGDEPFVTAFVAIFDPLFGELRYASAGHPRPLVRLPDGRVERLHAEGLPLGLRDRSADERSRVLTLEPGSTLLFFTDGITEIDRDPVAGERRLSETFGEHGADLSAPAVFTRTIAARTARDDVALLALAYERTPFEVDGTRRAYWWRFDSTDEHAAANVRAGVRSVLAALAVRDEDAALAELALGELMGNVVRYAPGWIEVALDATGPRPVLHVLDDGPGFEMNPRLPSDPMAERGRGLFIVDALSDELIIGRRSAGGSHARAVLRLTLRGARAERSARTQPSRAAG